MQYFLSVDSLVNGIVAIFFGLIVLIKNRKNIVNQTGFLLTLATAFWALGYWQWLMVYNDKSLALYWTRILSIGSTLIPVFYFHWIVSLLDLNKQKRTLVVGCYVIAAFFLFFSFSPLFVKDVQPVASFAFWPEAGPLYSAYLFFIYFGAVFYSIYLLISRYKHSDGIKKQQIKFVLLGSALGFGGGATNFFLWYNVNILPVGNVLVVLYPIIFSYSIIKHHLMNVRVVATEIFTLLISIILLINSIYSNSVNIFILNSAIFLAVTFFGILLIRSVLKEVRSKEELAKLTLKLQAAYEDLKVLDKAKSEFLSMASHQLRTPLSAIKGYISMLIEGSYGKVPKRAQEKMRNVFLSNERLIRLVNDLLDISKIEMGKMELDKAPTQIEEMIQSCCDEIRINAQKKKLSLEFIKPDNPLPKVFIDSLKIRQVVMNLVDNAIRYTPQGGIEVKAEKIDSKVRISVKDTGEGLSDDEKKSIFERFSRGSAGLAHFVEGAGLGLYTAKKFLELHNGRIWAESEGKGKGSTFSVELPIM
jgi:signal transduction histidine kinase